MVFLVSIIPNCFSMLYKWIFIHIYKIRTVCNALIIINSTVACLIIVKFYTICHFSSEALKRTKHNLWPSPAGLWFSSLFHCVCFTTFVPWGTFDCLNAHFSIATFPALFASINFNAHIRRNKVCGCKPIILTFGNTIASAVCKTSVLLLSRTAL